MSLCKNPETTALNFFSIRTLLSKNLLSVEIDVATAKAGVGEDAVPRLADEGRTLAAPHLIFRREAEEDLRDQVARQIGKSSTVVLGGAADDGAISDDVLVPHGHGGEER